MLLPYREHQPSLANPVFVAPGAHIIGQVQMGKLASAWFNAVIRADSSPITVGERTNVQDGAVLHTDRDLPMEVGSDVTIGHRVVLHGCRIHDRVLVGMGAIIMNRADIGSDTLIAAGTLIPEGKVIPPGSVVMGIPGRVIRNTTEEERAHILWSAAYYVELWQQSGW